MTRSSRSPSYVATRYALRLLAAAALALGGSAAAQACLVDSGDSRRDAPIDWGPATCLEGTANEDRQEGHYLVTIAGERRYAIRATSATPSRLEVCLDAPGGAHCRSGEGAAMLPDLVLSAGSHLVRFVGRLPTGSTYRIALEDVSAAREGFEREPNDRVETATVLGPDLAIRGRLEGREQDYFRIDVTGEPQLWRVQVIGGEVTTLRYHDASGRTQQERRAESGERGIRLSNLYLLPGPHYVSLDGTDADYALRLLPLGPPDDPGDAATAAGERPAERDHSLGAPMTPTPPPAGDDMVIERPTGPRPPGRMEREPNDDASRAHLLRPGEPYVGLLADAGDRDVYRFFLGEEAYVRVTVTPSADGAIETNFGGSFSSPGVGTAHVYEAWFLAGDHVLTLRPQTRSDGYYQILLEWLDPFALPDDLEPNDELYEARPLPNDFEVRGTVGTHRDADRFMLPAFTVETEVRAELTGDDVRFDSLRDPGGARATIAVQRDRETGVYAATVPAGEPYAVGVTGTGDYHLRLAFDPGPDSTPRPVAPPVAVIVHAEHDQVAAYHHVGQRLRLRVEVRNDGSEPQTLDLETHVSDHGWRAELAEGRLTLAPGEARSVPLLLSVLPVARDDLVVRVTVAARAGDGGVVRGSTELAAVCGAPAIDPRRVWPLPDPLLGGLNVAWMGLGSEPLTERRREFLLYDGLTPPDAGFNAERGSATTVRLAGDDPPQVLGVLLHPLGSGTVGAKLAAFRVSTSLDGITFTTAREDRMRSVPSEQAFVFDEGVPARYVRLEFLSRQDGNVRGEVSLGQFKVIAEPLSRPFAGAVDLARRAVGGYVPRSDPHLPLYGLTDAPGNRPLTARLDFAQEEAMFVVGFHHDRAALVDALEWQLHSGGDPERGLGAVEVAVSTGDALGPYTSLGSWDPRERSTWRFDEPQWARFIRFTASGLEPRSTVEYPAAVRVLEHPAGDAYRSILGEWGHYARDGAFEWRQGESAPGSISFEVENGTQATARVLSSGDEAAGRVLVGEYESWFRVDVPEGDIHLRLELAGDPTVSFAYELLDERGVPVDADVTSGAERVILEAYVAAGSYFLRAWEPPRSVIFAWDNSGSMGPYIDATYQTVVGFARDVSPEREQVQLLAFESEPAFVMDEWTGDAATLLSELIGYDRSAGSSGAETNLVFAVEQLALREGTKALLVVTDAESGSIAAATVALWRALDAVRPLVFTFETSTAGSDDTQDRMQSWAVGGFYDYSRTIGDLEIGFARVSCLLRQPKAVAVAVRTAAVAPPGPGTLEVRRRAPGAPDDGSAPALAVIFDASGSMGKLVPDGSASRLVVAREVLAELVDDVVEPGTPFALRAYGHVQPASCDTRLELPFAPLDRAAARRAIAGIDAKLLSGTPLARSIALVADDLGSATGPKTVILITDGEESCGGDPEAEIRALMERGIGVQLSIVSFDLDADDRAGATARFRAWAELGGGRAFDVASRDELRAALREALVPRVVFEVLGVDGAVVATGILDGDPVTLPTGTYRLRIAAQPEVVVENVSVRPEAATMVTLEE